MKNLSPENILNLLASINNFFDRAESFISSTKMVYVENKNVLSKDYGLALSNLDKHYSYEKITIRKKASDTINGAKIILDEINALDRKLSSIDKYYEKTKKNKEELLANEISQEYSETVDYFEAFDKIKERFLLLTKKYSDKLPAFINGINYFFSSKRKQEYEELIVLRNTVISFVGEIEKNLSTILNDRFSKIEDDYRNDKDILTKRYKANSISLENKYKQAMHVVANKIYDELDSILPDELVSNMAKLISTYENNLFNVNTKKNVANGGILNINFIDYDSNLFIKSKALASIVKEKCSIISSNGIIKLPLITSTIFDPIWMIVNDDEQNSSLDITFAHSVMFSFLSFLPVSKISYSIIDPENRGNSIAPFFDSKKKMPELFGEKIFIAKDDIFLKINKMNEFIENMIFDKLGNQYKTIFEYSKVQFDSVPEVELLVIFDFPKGFDEQSLSSLRNILRNGSKCGIYVIIFQNLHLNDDTYSKSYEQNLKSIRDLSSVIHQEGNILSFYGLPLTYHSMPTKIDFMKFFNKYILIYESIKNRGIAFSPLIKKLIDANNETEFDIQMNSIIKIKTQYERNFASVPKLDLKFPSIIMIGTVLYPSNIFSDSVGYNKLINFFRFQKVDKEATDYIELPLTFDLRKSFNLFFNCLEDNKIKILEFTYHIVWTFLSFIPLTKVNICVFDSEQRGNSIMPFLDFRKHYPEIFDEKIYTNQESISLKLKKINDKLDEFIIEKLGNKYSDFLDYNLKTPSRTEAVTLLLIYDFPSMMDNNGLSLLSNILRNGNRCGIFVIICYNPNVQTFKYMDMKEQLNQLTKFCTIIDCKEDKYILLPYNLQVNIPEKLSNKIMYNFFNEYLKRSAIIKKQGLSFKDIIKDKLFSKKSDEVLEIPVGIGDGDSIVSMIIGEGSSHHALIAGATGSGKYTLLHTLIMSSMLHYTPDELHLYLMDFKSGTEFKIYESVRLPHIQLLALDAMQEFGESILEDLIKEMEQRAKAFKEAGSVTKIKDYIKTTGKCMPRILVIMDEFQILFNDSTNRKVAFHCAELTKRIVTEGRAFGIHLLMATQSTKVITDLTLSHGTIEQMRIRVGLKCGETDARYLFSDVNDTKALAMMKGPVGTAVMNLDYTEKPNISFRTSYCDDNTQKYYLNVISKTFANQPYDLQIFEGNRNIELLHYFKESGISNSEEIPVKIYMGNLIKVAPPFYISIDRKRKHNLLICGSNEQMSTTILNNYIVSAMLNDNVKIYYLDGDVLVGENMSLKFYDELSNINSSFKMALNREDIINFIKDIYKFYISKKKLNTDEVIFVVMKNLQFLDIVKSMLKGEMIDESEFLTQEFLGSDDSNFNDPFAAINNKFSNNSSDDDISISEKLIKLIEDGSGFGINFVITSLEYQTVRDCMYYGENVLSKFPERIVFSLNENDAESLIDNISINGLPSNIVYFTDSVKNTFQLKPYIAPSIDELKSFINIKD